MAAHHCFTIAVLFLGILTIVRTISIPYKDIHLAFPATTRLFYTASESDPSFSGYSYATHDLNGGGSNVVFATGADSVSKLKKAMNSIYESDAIMKMPEKYMQKDTLDNTQDNSQEDPTSAGQSKPEIEASMSKQEGFVLNADVSNEERKLSKNPEVDDSFLKYQTSFQDVPFVRVPYPALRANFLNLQLPAVLPRYHAPSNVIQSQYYPHNPYAHLRFPLHDFDLYNPPVPLLYQAPIIANQVPVDNLSHALTAVKDMTISVKANIAESSRTNATQFVSSIESNMLESKSNFKSNKAEEASSHEPAPSTFEPMITSKEINEETTTEFAKPTVRSRKCSDQIVKNKVSNTEPANTEVSNSTENSSAETSTMPTTTEM
ncbi:uncharacterized protein LOC116845104 [Odontomachus brunneus]|uniref:uncharacterized protein LOC116845104 n=1 Tax=Odontomachus brunneus TaxID=486640 RepID=UPI0013F1E0F6|nr:uncharacterized protein LOC116845104 [Odontomachus brunneus]